MINKKVEVIEILGEPKVNYMNLDGKVIRYWSVPVLLIERESKKIYEGSVTYNKLKEAISLKIGETFDR